MTCCMEWRMRIMTCVRCDFLIGRSFCCDTKQNGRMQREASTVPNPNILVNSRPWRQSSAMTWKNETQISMFCQKHCRMSSTNVKYLLNPPPPKPLKCERSSEVDLKQFLFPSRQRAVLRKSLIYNVCFWTRKRKLIAFWIREKRRVLGIFNFSGHRVIIRLHINASIVRM